MTPVCRYGKNGIVLIPLFFLMVSCSPLIVRWPDPGPGVPPPPETATRSVRFVVGTENPDRIVSLGYLLTPEEPEFALRRDFIVPALRYTDPRISVSLGDFVETDGPVFRDLDDLALPEKLAAFDGCYPDDPDYPLIRWTILRIEETSSRMRRREESLNALLRKHCAAVLSADCIENPSPRMYRMAAVGDIMPGRGFGELLLVPEGVDKALGDVAALLSTPDLLIGNLETAVTESKEAVKKSYNFKVSEDVLDAVVALGFDFFHLANNHGWDYGEAGFRDTLDAVNRTGAGYSGAGLDLEGARFAWETETHDGRRIRVLSLGAYFTERNGFDGASTAAAGEGKPGVLWDSPENEDFIRSVLVRDDAFTVVTVHGGYEWENEPRDDVKALFRRYVDWGADLVLAHHPHVLQGMEFYGGGLIAYSLGNFIFPGMAGWYTGEETGVLDLRLYDGRIVGVDFHPIRIDDTRLRRAEGEGITKRFWEMSAELDS